MTTLLTHFERALLQRAIGAGPERTVLERQLAAAAVKERRNTGHGMFVEIAISRSAPTLNVQPKNRQLPGAKNLLLSHPELAYGAGTIVWVRAGLIDSIECFTHSEAWPADEAGFVVTQAPVKPGDGASV